MERLIVLAGIGQLTLALVSLVIPRVLDWREETAKLRPLTRQVFWTYAAYIWGSHVAFGLLSVLAPGALLDGSLLARCVTGFIAAWWGVRLTLHFTSFDRSARPPGVIYVLAEIGLVTLFIANFLIYLAAAVRSA
jgi:hypothetical protein